MAFPFMLLAAQAAGIGLSLYQNASADRMERLGYRMDEQNLRLNQAQLDLRMDEEGAKAAEQSLFDIKQLRGVLASQRAIFAARGQFAGAGSANTIREGSVNEFNQDVASKKFTERFRKNYLTSQRFAIGSKIAANKIEQFGRKAQRGNELMLQGINMFNSNALFDDFSNAISTNPAKRGADAFALSKRRK